MDGSRLFSAVNGYRVSHGQDFLFGAASNAGRAKCKKMADCRSHPYIREFRSVDACKCLIQVEKADSRQQLTPDLKMELIFWVHLCRLGRAKERDRGFDPLRKLSLKISQLIQ